MHARAMTRFSRLSRSFFSSLCGGRTRCFRGLRGAMHTIPGIRARCNNVLHTTRRRPRWIQPELQCHFNERAQSDAALHTRTSLIAKARTSGTERACLSCLLRRIVTEDLEWLNLYLRSEKEYKSEITCIDVSCILVIRNTNPINYKINCNFTWAVLFVRLPNFSGKPLKILGFLLRNKRTR